MDADVVRLSPLTANAPAGAQEAVDKAKADIVSGKFKLWTGPIKDNTGKEVVPAGVTLTDQQVTGAEFNWLVEGVIGKVEKQ
jgi:basic membrane protein A